MKHAWTVTEVAKMLDLTPDAARELVATVFEGPRDVLSFQDLTLLRTAVRLGKSEKKAQIARALSRVKEQLPADEPLTPVTLQKVGRELVVNTGRSKWNAKSGQVLLDFGPSRTTLLRPVPTRDAEALFAKAVALEETDPRAALDAYAEAVAADPHHADAHVNLGRLLHQEGRLREAEAHYVAALVARPTDATATFNLAVVLEDLGRTDDALARYRETIELDPNHVDAYFNLSRLYEKKGEKLAALRHLKDYRRLTSNR
ncbi:MAG: tetratricopeptide repeat protein [Myxococcota bacterium]